MIHDLSILVVEDDLVNITLFEELLKQEGYKNFHTYTDPLEAFEYAKEQMIDALIVDYNMPKMDGIELCSRLKKIYPDLVSIMITASNDEKMMEKALQSGVTEFLNKPISPVAFKLRLKNILSIAASLAFSKSFNTILHQKVEEATKALRESEYEALEVLSDAAEYKDPETASHIARVSHYSKLIAQKYGLDEKEQNIIFYAAPLHDIGKIGIPDSILLKPGRLTKEEFEKMKEHSKIGAEILSAKKNEFLQAGHLIALHHHEKYDGSGYPAGLEGEEISLYGRIVAIADVFDALTSERPYKKAWSFEDATSLLEREKGKHFDPYLVNLFLSSQDEVMSIFKRFKE